MNEMAKIENVLIQGDLSRLDPETRTKYYLKVCETLGLNPLTKPFEYIRLNGKEVLYATRTCTEQLRKVHGVSIRIVGRETIGDVYVVTARAISGSREDESTGVVSIKGLSGDSLANAFMKTETKAKRRVTLSICGLGLLDESEVATINREERKDAKFDLPPRPDLPLVRVQTGTAGTIVSHDPTCTVSAPPLAADPILQKKAVMLEEIKKRQDEENAIRTGPPINSDFAHPKADLNLSETDSIYVKKQRILDGRSTDKQRGLIGKLVLDLGWDNQTAKDWLNKSFGVATREELDKKQASAAIELLNAMIEDNNVAAGSINFKRSEAEFLKEIESL